MGECWQQKTHHPWREDATTSAVGLKKQSHTQKSHPKWWTREIQLGNVQGPILSRPGPPPFCLAFILLYLQASERVYQNMFCVNMYSAFLILCNLLEWCFFINSSTVHCRNLFLELSGVFSICKSIFHICGWMLIYDIWFQYFLLLVRTLCVCVCWHSLSA